ERYRDDPCWQRISADWQKTSDQYYVLKHFHWLLSKDEDLDIFDPGREGQYNRHFQKYMTLLELQEILLGTDPEPEETVRLKRVLTRMYESGTYDDDGRQLFNDTYVQFRNSDINEMYGFSKTMKEWKDEIFNSFNTVAVEYMVNSRSEYSRKYVKLHNGIIENCNKMIKCMKHNSYGFTNWARFRNRVMYVLDPKASYSLEPRFESKAVKKKDQ
ncbi:transposase, partial [Faecalibaculum rodentium]|uniref:transposase n=1 Tax=Faecalibaculum rodentium TaxID=1702221 RepID=UPI001F5881F4